MTPDLFILHFTLRRCAMAIHESLMAVYAPRDGHADKAVTACLDAAWAAEGLYMQGSPQRAAICEILGACEPDPFSEHDLPVLFNALDALCLAMDSGADQKDVCLWDAEAAVERVSPLLRGAFSVILAEVQRMAQAGNGVSA